MSKLSCHEFPSANKNCFGFRLFAVCKPQLFLANHISLSHPLSRNPTSSSDRYRACVPITHRKVIWSGSNDLDRQWTKNNGKSASPMAPVRKAKNDSKLAWRGGALPLFRKLASHELLSANVSLFRCRRFAIGKPYFLPQQVWPNATSPSPQYRAERAIREVAQTAFSDPGRHLTNNNGKVTSRT